MARTICGDVDDFRGHSNRALAHWTGLVLGISHENGSNSFQVEHLEDGHSLMHWAALVGNKEPPCAVWERVPVRSIREWGHLHMFVPGIGSWEPTYIALFMAFWEYM